MPSKKKTNDKTKIAEQEKDRKGKAREKLSGSTGLSLGPTPAQILAEADEKSNGKVSPSLFITPLRDRLLFV